MDAVSILSYLAIGLVIALLISWITGQPLSIRPANLASGLIMVAALYALRVTGMSFELSILLLIVAVGVWYIWRRFRAQTA